MRSSIRFICTSLITDLILTAGIASAQAQPIRHFNLPEQTLGASLREIGAQGNLNVLFDAPSVEDIQVPAIDTTGTADEVLRTLLKGSGYQHRFLNETTVVLAEVRNVNTLESSADAHEISIAPSAASSALGLPGHDSHEISNSDDADAEAHDEKNLEAKEADVRVAEVLVTGSHIKGIENGTNQVIVIDEQQINRSGYSSARDFFRSFPQNFTSSDTAEDGRFGNATALSSRNQDYSAGVNLRGLGASSTLVLLDGHRLAPSGLGGFVDVSSIPLAAVERIEVMPSGSSAIYGSDAVGGVVNVILKRNYVGGETSLRYGSVTDGGRHEEVASQTLGTAWSGGSVVGAFQYDRRSALAASDRNFADSLGNPSFLLPRTKNYSATINGRTSVSDVLEFYTDVLLHRRDFDGAQTTNYPDYGTYAALTTGDGKNINFAPGLRYAITPKWSVSLNGLYGIHRSNNRSATTDPVGDITYVANDEKFVSKSIDLIIDGRFSLWNLDNVGAAFGASFRDEELDAMRILTAGSESPFLTPTTGSRTVKALFGELYVPVVRPEDQVVLISALEVTAAIRRDEYSEFGSTTNPRFGLHWAPTNELSLRVAYGRSFRAPSALEEIAALPAYQSAYTFRVPGSSGEELIPTLVLSGGKALSPERARAVDIGADYRPSWLEGVNVGIDYYNIVYRDRIVIPGVPPNFLRQAALYGELIKTVADDASAQAIADSVVSAGGEFTDYYGDGVAGVRYLYDGRQQNAAIVRQSGIDLSAAVVRDFGTGTVSTDLGITYIDKIDRQLAVRGTSINQVNTFGNPVRWRGRLSSTLVWQSWAFTGAINRIGRYTNNTLPDVERPIAPWTTFDLTVSWNSGDFSEARMMRGTTVSLFVKNMLNDSPPDVDASSALVDVRYDPANADPLRRFVSLSLKRQW